MDIEDMLEETPLSKNKQLVRNENKIIEDYEKTIRELNEFSDDIKLFYETMKENIGDLRDFKNRYLVDQKVRVLSDLIQSYLRIKEKVNTFNMELLKYYKKEGSDEDYDIHQIAQKLEEYKKNEK